MIRPPTSMIMMRSESMEKSMHREVMSCRRRETTQYIDADQVMVADFKQERLEETYGDPPSDVWDLDSNAIIKAIGVSEMKLLRHSMRKIDFLVKEQRHVNVALFVFRDYSRKTKTSYIQQDGADLYVKVDQVHFHSIINLEEFL